MDQIRALRQVDVAEGCVAVVARPRQHQVLAADATRKQDAIAVEGQEGVVELMKSLEVVGVTHADCRSVVTVAPGHVVAILEPGDTRVVGVLEALLDLADSSIGGTPLDRVRIEGPVKAVGAAGGVEVHHARRVVDTEDARKTLAEGHDGRVEDAVRPLEQVPPDDRVAARAPHHCARPGRSVFPRDVRECAGRRFGRRGQCASVVGVHSGPFVTRAEDRDEARGRSRTAPGAPGFGRCRVP